MTVYGVIGLWLRVMGGNDLEKVCCRTLATRTVVDNGVVILFFLLLVFILLSLLIFREETSFLRGIIFGFLNLSVRSR